MLAYRYDKTLHMGCAGRCESVGEEVLLNSSLLIFNGKYGDYLPIMKMFRRFLRVGNNLRNGVYCNDIIETCDHVLGKLFFSCADRASIGFCCCLRQYLIAIFVVSLSYLCSMRSVLCPKYSNIEPKILEYCAENTPVFYGKYWQTHKFTKLKTVKLQ